MAVPKRRKSKSRVRTNRAHQAVRPVATISCPNCQAVALPHRICGNCGYYQGRVVVKTEE